MCDFLLDDSEVGQDAAKLVQGPRNVLGFIIDEYQLAFDVLYPESSTFQLRGGELRSARTSSGGPP